MGKFSFKIAFSIIAAGLFIVVSFAALNYENLSLSFHIVSSFIIAFIFLFGFAMGHAHALPVRELLKKVDNVKMGNFRSKLQLRTKDEIEEISNAFNQVTEGLEKNIEDARALKKSTDIKLKTKDIMSEKIIDALEEKIKNRTTDLERAIAETDQLKKQLREKKERIFIKKKEKKNVIYQDTR